MAQTLVRVIYCADTFKIRRVVIPSHDEHLAPHVPLYGEKHIDLTNDEYRQNVHIKDDEELPDPNALSLYVEAREKADSAQSE